MSVPESVHILLIEDNEIDVRAVKRAFRKGAISNPLHVAPDGIEGLRMLRGEGCEAVPQPYIIILDLNLPRLGGIELLEILREDLHLRESVVFVLTTSEDDRDRIKAYQHNVAGYISKQTVSPDFAPLAKLLKQYWKLVELPQ